MHDGDHIREHVRYRVTATIAGHAATRDGTMIMERSLARIDGSTHATDTIVVDSAGKTFHGNVTSSTMMVR